MAEIYLYHNPDNTHSSIPDFDIVTSDNQVTFYAKGADFELVFEDPVVFEPLERNPVIVKNGSSKSLTINRDLDKDIVYTAECLICNQPLEAPPKIVVGGVTK